MAAIATEHALADVPGYGLARLVQASLHHAIPPEAISSLIADTLATHPLTALADTHPDNDPTTPDGPTTPHDAPPTPHEPPDREPTDDREDD